MSSEELLYKYKRKFLESEIFLNWEPRVGITNDGRMFCCVFQDYKENIIGFKVTTYGDENFISIFWQGEEDKIFDMTNDGYQEAMHVLSFQLELFKKNNKYTY